MSRARDEGLLARLRRRVGARTPPPPPPPFDVEELAPRERKPSPWLVSEDDGGPAPAVAVADGPPARWVVGDSTAEARSTTSTAPERNGDTLVWQPGASPEPKPERPVDSPWLRGGQAPAAALAGSWVVEDRRAESQQATESSAWTVGTAAPEAVSEPTDWLTKPVAETSEPSPGRLAEATRGYCGELLGDRGPAVAEAVLEGFAGGGAAALLEQTRSAAADHFAAQVSGPTADCSRTAVLLAQRDSGTIGRGDLKQLGSHLNRCVTCQATELRAKRAERVFHALADSAAQARAVAPAAAAPAAVAPAAAAPAPAAPAPAAPAAAAAGAAAAAAAGAAAAAADSSADTHSWSTAALAPAAAGGGAAPPPPASASYRRRRRRPLLLASAALLALVVVAVAVLLSNNKSNTSNPPLTHAAAPPPAAHHAAASHARHHARVVKHHTVVHHKAAVRHKAATAHTTVASTPTPPVYTPPATTAPSTPVTSAPPPPAPSSSSGSSGGSGSPTLTQGSGGGSLPPATGPTSTVGSGK
ncbi:MAG TPA: hypothetical protein VG410_06690 [Solirubrobacteraceae bacterium]|nr:hypothetical protein [Solirubrobacteraceae bacterium]